MLSRLKLLKLLRWPGTQPQIIPSTSTFTDYLNCIASFTFDSITYLLCGHASAPAHILPQSQFTQDIKDTFDHTLYWALTLIDLFLHLPTSFTRHFTLPYTYHQCDEFNSSLRPSRATPGIEPMAAWAPACQHLGGVCSPYYVFA
jgi:hypothetical protein